MALEQPNVPTVLSLLRDSLNADQTLRGQAVDTLSRYESRPGFCSCLVDIITAKVPPSDDDVRHSASIYLQKNIKCYWGNSLYISEYEKTNLRNKLLSHLQEENDQIAKMLVIIISKIARSDYPQEWPDLFSDLAKQLLDGDIRTSGRIVEVLSPTMSTLSRKDLEASGFVEILSLLLRCFLHLWKKDQGLIFDSFFSKQSIAINTSLEQQLHLICERWLLCLSMIQRLIIQFRGDANPVKVPLVKEVCEALIQAIKSLAQYYYTVPDDPKLSLIHKVCINLMKCLFEIQHCHPTSFDDKTVRDPFLEFCVDRIMKPGDEISPLFEEFLIECMVMAKSVWKRFRYKLLRNHQNVGNTPLPGLRSEHVQDLCKILITRYFLLTENDLKKWSQDPEWFYHETNYYLEHNQFSEKPKRSTLRPHADDLYVVVFRSYVQLLGPFVTTIFHDATEDRPTKETDSHPEMFLREAAYTAVAHVYDHLFDKLDFKKLFEDVLYPDIQNNHHLYMRIIHRKIAFIIQKVHFVFSCSPKCHMVAVDSDMRKQMFCALLELLNYNDLVVRLAAWQPLAYLVEEIDFQKDVSMDLLLSYWHLCFELQEVIQDFHTKNLVLDWTIFGIIKIGENLQEKSVMTKIGENLQEKSVMTKIGERIIPFANKLVEVWKVPTGRMFLKSQVLRALHCLSELGIRSPFCYDILLSELEMCKELNDPDFMNYGMLFWESTISHSPSLDSQLRELFPHVEGIMKKIINFPNEIDHISDLLKVGTKIIHGYIILGGKTFLSEHASIIQKLLVDIHAKLKMVSGFSPKDTEVFDFVASIAARVEGLTTDKIDSKLNIGELNSRTVKDTHICGAAER